MVTNGIVVKRLRIYDLSPDLTTQMRRKLTFVYKHEDDENFNEIFHYNTLFQMVEEWMKEFGLASDYEREPKIGGLVEKAIIEIDSGRPGYLSIDGEPGDWDLTIQYPVEGETIFGFHEVTLLGEAS